MTPRRRRGSGGIVPHILDTCTKQNPVANFTFQPLYTRGEIRPYALDKNLGGPKKTVSGDEKKTLLVPIELTESRLPTLRLAVMMTNVTVLVNYFIQATRVFVSGIVNICVSACGVA
jgi:hypothetical protein